MMFWVHFIVAADSQCSYPPDKIVLCLKSFFIENVLYLVDLELRRPPIYRVGNSSQCLAALPRRVYEELVTF